MKVPRRLLPLAVMLCLALGAANAQRISMSSLTGPAVIHVPHSVTIPPILAVVATPAAPVSGGPFVCPAACLASTVTVKANTRWQLQVSLSQPLANDTIDVIEPGGSATHRLTPGVPLIVAAGDEPTLQRSVTLAFVVRGDAPFDASIAGGLLSYRVVPLP